MNFTMPKIFICELHELYCSILFPGYICNACKKNKTLLLIYCYLLWCDSLRHYDTVFPFLCEISAIQLWNIAGHNMWIFFTHRSFNRLCDWMYMCQCSAVNDMFPPVSPSPDAFCPAAVLCQTSLVQSLPLWVTWSKFVSALIATDKKILSF